MKRIGSHIVFWCLYLIQTATIEYLWGKATIPQLSPGTLLVASIAASFCYAIAKVCFSYYFCYYAIENIIQGKRTIYQVAEIIIVLFGCLILHRTIENAFVIPYVYHHYIETASVFEPRRLMICFLFIVYVTGIMMTIKFVRQRLEASEKEKSLIKDKLEAELKFLKNQTNPHFLLNTLNNIYALSRKQSEYTSEAIMRLSELLRFMLYEANKKWIYLKEEIKIVEDYFELQMMRYDSRLDVSFNKETDANDYRIAPLLFLPFIENAFKYGASESTANSFIHLELEVRNGLLYFEIENSYDRLSDREKQTNIGLANIRRQLELTYKSFELDFFDTNGVFKVVLSLNLKSYDEI